jgi:phosphatidylserine decarboxylase
MAMKHAGKARKAAFKLLFITFVAGLVLWGMAFLGSIAFAVISSVALPILLIVWIVFSVFTFYFFRDPTPSVPVRPNIVVSPAHGKVDVIEKFIERDFMGGECQRISMFLSVIDVHVQNAPVGGKIVFYRYKMGEFMNAIKAECAECNENVYLGFESTEPAGEKIGLRLIAGVIARRIVPFVNEGDEVARGERISLIQFGSRADIYLPLKAKIAVKLGDHIVGGETVVATFD